MALAPCIIDGTRREAFEWFHVAAERSPHLIQLGLVVSHPMLGLMSEASRVVWEQVATQRGRPAGLQPSTFVVPQPIIEQLWDADGRILSPFDWSSYQPEPVTGGGERPLRVLQLTHFDPGCSVYRYHSAANTVPGVLSALVRWDYNNPYCHLRQWDGEADMRTVEALAATADVLHVHMDYRCLLERLRYVPQPWQRVVITYHGSHDPEAPPNRQWVWTETDTALHAVRLGARPYHLRHGIAEHWLPIPMPVRDYQTLATKPRHQSNEPFLVAHSPTRRSIKGTEAFLSACRWLREGEGLNIQPVLLEEMPHGEALARKAACHAVFDSFWLGIQGSGLEGAAMGLPVLAGDPEAQGDLTRLGIPVPYTVANDGTALRDQLRRLVREPEFYAAEASRALQYVQAHHDYPAVGARYRAILREAVAAVPLPDRA